MYLRLFPMLLAASLAVVPNTGLFAQEDSPTPAPTAQSPADEAIAILEDTSLPIDTRRELLLAIVNHNPESGEAWAAYGELLNEMGDIDKAMLAFEKATKVNPSLHSPWMWIGILSKRGNPTPDLPRAEQALRRALTEGAPKAQTLNELGVTLALQGKMDDAIDAWESAIADDPEWGVLYSNLYKGARSKGDTKLMERYFQAALDAERFEPSAVMMYGEYLVEKGDEDDAADVYARALAVHPNNARMHYYRGVALGMDGKKDAARAELRLAGEAAAGDDREADIVQMVEFELFRLDNPADEKKFQEARKLVFNDNEKPDPKAIEKNLKRAIETLDPLLEKHPTFWNGYFIRGVAHRRLDERKEARADLEKVIELHPGEPNATMQLALMERDDFNFERAAELAEEGLRLAPRDPLFVVNAGFIMIEAGRCDRAWELYHQAIRMIGEANAVVLKDELDIKCRQK